ncbi:MAG: SGNH/GDSL hydrolase family protein [Planctomycetes bacterium]|nr:SGNH/GDSL hydrolase family protein [Planctomycetota bacterium]
MSLRAVAIFAILLAGVSVLPGTAADLAPSLAGKRVLWLGDSITSGASYVGVVEYYLEQRHPELMLDIINVGKSSETTSGLSEKVHPGPRPCVHDRLARALALTRPALVVACYGMNDGIYHPQSPERLQAFQAGIAKLVATCTAAGARVVLLTPPPFDPLPGKGHVVPIDAPDFGYQTPYADYDRVLGDYAAWEQTLTRSQAWVIDLHGPMDAYLAERRASAPGFVLSGDGIHPQGPGQVLMAETILAGLGAPVTGAAADVQAERARLDADPLFALVMKRCGTRAEAWRTYVAPSGDTAEAKAAVEAAERTCAELQTQIDGLRRAK